MSAAICGPSIALGTPSRTVSRPEVVLRDLTSGRDDPVEDRRPSSAFRHALSLLDTSRAHS